MATNAAVLVVCRENTEGFYADRSMFAGVGEFMPTPDMAISLRKITRQVSARIAETAFQLARQRRRKVTVMHKGNVLNLTDGLFRETAFDIAARYPDVTVDEVLTDAMFALVVHHPEKSNVIVTCRSCKPRMLRKLGVLRSTRGRVFGRICNTSGTPTGTSRLRATGDHPRFSAVDEVFGRDPQCDDLE